MKKGFIFLEIVIGIGLISIVFVVLLGLVVQLLTISTSMRNTTQIDSLLKEEIEAVRSYRDGATWSLGLGAINTGANPYYLTLDDSVPKKWVLNSGSETVGAFTRNFVVEKVSRDGSFNIEAVYNALHDDANTRKITANIIWSDKTYQIVAYLTNWQE